MSLHVGKRGDSLWIYRHGPFCMSVCSSMTPEDTVAEVNRRDLTVWELSKDEQFADGHPNPAPCSDSESHRHYLLEARP